MAKYKEIVSMVLDELKITSDDSIFTEEHIIFLAGRYRSFLLKQRYYSDIKKQIPESNYQTICLDLTTGEVVEGLPCEGGYYLRSLDDVPALLPIGNPRVGLPDSIFKGDIAYISPDRLRYVGNNKWMDNIIYASIAGRKLVLKSNNPQYLYLEKATVRGIFENAEEASELECDNQDSKKCDILDRDFPMEDALIAPLIELIIKELSPSIAAPEDKENNANDDLSPESQSR
jgi:hypothetical protein